MVKEFKTNQMVLISFSVIFAAALFLKASRTDVLLKILEIFGQSAT